MKRLGRRNTLIFTGFSSLSLARYAVLLPQPSFASVRAAFFETPMQTQELQLSKNPLGFRGQRRAAETASSGLSHQQSPSRQCKMLAVRLHRLNPEKRCSAHLYRTCVRGWERAFLDVINAHQYCLTFTGLYQTNPTNPVLVYISVPSVLFL